MKNIQAKISTDLYEKLLLYKLHSNHATLSAAITALLIAQLKEAEHGKEEAHARGN